MWRRRTAKKRKKRRAATAITVITAITATTAITAIATSARMGSRVKNVDESVRDYLDKETQGLS